MVEFASSFCSCLTQQANDSTQQTGRADISITPRSASNHDRPRDGNLPAPKRKKNVGGHSAVSNPFNQTGRANNPTQVRYRRRPRAADPRASRPILAGGRVTPAVTPAVTQSRKHPAPVFSNPPLLTCHPLTHHESRSTPSASKSASSSCLSCVH